MSNNKSIQILRGSAGSITGTVKANLLNGQPLLDKTNNYLYVGNGSNSSLQPITTNRVVYDVNHKIEVASSGTTITGATNVNGSTIINGATTINGGVISIGNTSYSTTITGSTATLKYDNNHKIDVSSDGIYIDADTGILIEGGIDINTSDEDGNVAIGCLAAGTLSGSGNTSIYGDTVVLAGGRVETTNQGRIELSSEGPQVSIQGTDIKIADENNYNKIVLSSSDGTYLNSTEYISLYAGANTSSGYKAGISLNPIDGISVVADNGITLTTNTDDSDSTISLNAVTDAPGKYKSKISLNPFNGISVRADNGISVVAYDDIYLESETNISLEPYGNMSLYTQYGNIYIGADHTDPNAHITLESPEINLNGNVNATNITGTGMTGSANDAAPLQGYARDKGTIEERLTNLGFKQGSLKDSSNNTIATLTRMGYYVLVNCVRAGTSSSFSGVGDATLDDFKPQSNRTNTISLPVYYGSDSARVIIACNMSANGILFISGSISGLGGWSEGTMNISATFGYNIKD